MSRSEERAKRRAIKGGKGSGQDTSLTGQIGATVKSAVSTVKADAKALKAEDDRLRSMQKPGH